jgi:hypothetical protein
MPHLSSEQQAKAEKLASVFTAFLILGLLFIWHYYLTRYWGRWGSINVDFGRELYIPWQITQGKLLYKDIAHINGPLSQYVNALVFFVFGASIDTLEIANLTIAAFVSIAIWKIVSTLTNNAVAILSVIVFSLMSVFSHDYDGGIFSFIAPYSHEITHGILIGLLGILQAYRYARRPSLVAAFVLGGIAGLSFLTKPEIALAVFASTSLGFILTIKYNVSRSQDRLHHCLAMGIGLALPFSLALAGLSFFMPIQEAWAGVTRMWRMTFHPGIIGNYFYKNVTGTLHLWHNIRTMSQAGVFFFAALLYIIGGSFVAKKLPRCGGALSVLLISIVSLYAISLVPFGEQTTISIYWTTALPPLSLATSLYIITVHTNFTNTRNHILLCSLCIFSTFLSLKIFLNARPFHYGNFLLVPSLILFCMALLYYIPSSFKGKHIKQTVSCCALITLFFFIYPRVFASELQLKNKNTPIESTDGSIYWDNRAEAVNELIAALTRQPRELQSLAVLPEGAMINFITRKPNPTPFINMMPPEWTIFGKDNILASYRSNPPDLICFINTSIISYGIESFEESYGLPIVAFTEEHYEEIAHGRRDQFYYKLYKRKNLQ